jgi:hypothetical protein
MLRSVYLRPPAWLPPEAPVDRVWAEFISWVRFAKFLRFVWSKKISAHDTTQHPESAPYSSDVRFTSFGKFSVQHQPRRAEKTSAAYTFRAVPKYSVVKEPVSSEVYTREAATVARHRAKRFGFNTKLFASAVTGF